MFLYYSHILDERFESLFQLLTNAKVGILVIKALRTEPDKENMRKRIFLRQYYSNIVIGT